MDLLLGIVGCGVLALAAWLFHKRFAEPPQTHDTTTRQELVAPDETDALRHSNNPAPFS